MPRLHTQATHQRFIAFTCLALAGAGLMTACSGTTTRNQQDNMQASDPVEAYKQRSRAEALELFRKASKLHEEGEFDEALIAYRQSIEEDNTIFATWNNMGQLLVHQKNYADAVAAYKIASDLQKTDPRPDYNIGLAYQTIGWGDESFTHFERSLERDPNYLPSIRGIVRSAEMLGLGTQKVLGFISSGQLRETDDQWREYFSRQRFRVQKLIEEGT